MPRVHEVQKARKAIKGAGIKVGDKYYWWKFRHGGKRVSKTYPKRQELTQSGFLASVYDLEDRIADLSSGTYESADDLKSELDDIASEIRSLGEEQQERLDSMPEALQDSSPSGQLLTERVDACEAWADEIEGIDIEEPDEDAIRAEISRTMLAEPPSNTAMNEIELQEKVADRLATETADCIAAAIQEAQGTEPPSS